MVDFSHDVRAAMPIFREPRLLRGTATHHSQTMPLAIGALLSGIAVTPANLLACKGGGIRQS